MTEQMQVSRHLQENTLSSRPQNSSGIAALLLARLHEQADAMIGSEVQKQEQAGWEFVSAQKDVQSLSLPAMESGNDNTHALKSLEQAMQVSILFKKDKGEELDQEEEEEKKDNDKLEAEAGSAPERSSAAEIETTDENALTLDQVMAAVNAQPQLEQQLSVLMASSLSQPEKMQLKNQLAEYLSSQAGNPALSGAEQELVLAAEQAVTDPAFIQNLESNVAHLSMLEAQAVQSAVAIVPQLNRVPFASVAQQTADTVFDRAPPVQEVVAVSDPDVTDATVSAEETFSPVTQVAETPAPNNFVSSAASQDLAQSALLNNAFDSSILAEFGDTIDSITAVPEPQPEMAYSGEVSQSASSVHAGNPFYLGGSMMAPMPNFSDPAFGGSGIPGSDGIASASSFSGN